MKKNFDPFKNLVLDAEEQAIEDAFERGKYVSVPDLEESKKMLQQAAINTLKKRKDKSITLRINELDLEKVKIKAAKKRIPYQTLLGLLISQYADGDLRLSI
jgi:predicted DNA binding CopG/RHH family protein